MWIVFGNIVEGGPTPGAINRDTCPPGQGTLPGGSILHTRYRFARLSDARF